MSLSSAFADFEREIASTHRMLSAFPEASASWKPHEKSHTLVQLANHVATLPLMGVSVLTADSLDLARRAPQTQATTARDLVAKFEEGVAPLRSALGAADAASLARTWTLRAGEREIVSGPRSELLRTMVLSHMIHHRGQLSVYYRLVGAPVPGMYGPSADER